VEDAPNSAFNHQRSHLLLVATAFFAIVAISAIFPANGGNSNLWGFGTLTVAAMAASSLYSKSHPASKSRNNVPKSVLVQNERALQLQSCSYNVEILLDGCTHPLSIDAPSGRLVDVVIENVNSATSEDDECVTEYDATLNFPVTADTVILDLEANGNVDALPQSGFQCARMVPGRPFIDAAGGSLQALPLITGDGPKTSLSWTSDISSMETHASPKSNATTHGRSLIGEDWIQRALGEHASVASFSAFSIALMSNGAPSHLVDDALKAGLDEVRHSRVSFDIASKLTGKDVGPGPLPESRLEFDRDLKALALAVAKEGCVDETLSAFAAAVEVEHITDVLNQGLQDTPYSNIDHDLLSFIRNELVNIAMDESNHSALAWRTLNWACSVDQTVCDAVYEDVFEEKNLERRFNQRADTLHGDTSGLFHLISGEWKKIFQAHQRASSEDRLETEPNCIVDGMLDAGEGNSGGPLLASVTKNVISQVSCS